MISFSKVFRIIQNPRVYHKNTRFLTFDQLRIFYFDEAQFASLLPQVRTENKCLVYIGIVEFALCFKNSFAAHQTCRRRKLNHWRKKKSCLPCASRNSRVAHKICQALKPPRISTFLKNKQQLQSENASRFPRNASNTDFDTQQLCLSLSQDIFFLDYLQI